MRFKNRAAIVTGGASGIGLAIATRLADEGATVTVWDISADNLAKLGGTPLKTRQVDVTDPDAVDAAHVPGAGHAHMYLNGLKLGRVFGGEYRIGTLPPGTHSLRVALNTNDHRAYATADGPVSASVTLTAD